MRPEVTSRPTRRHLLALGAGALALAMSPAGALAQQDMPVAKMTTREAHDAAQAGEIILVDIRTPEEWRETGIGEGAIALDMRTDDFVKRLVDLRIKYPDTPIALICRTGNRSQFATSALAGQGFPGLVDVVGGMAGSRKGKGWLAEGLPVYQATPEEITARLKAVFEAPGNTPQAQAPASE